MKKILYTLLPLLSLASCSQESSLSPDAGRDELHEMVLWSNVGELNAEVSTRVADIVGAIGNNLATNLYFARQDKNIIGADTYPGYNSSTILSATRAAGTGTAPSAVTFDATNKQYYCMEKPYGGSATNAYRSSKLVGWFPKGSLASGDVTIPVDGNTDIMLSNEKECSYTSQLSSSTAFTFAHLLTRITVEIKPVDADAPARWGSVTDVSVANQSGRKCIITLPAAVSFTSSSTALRLIGSPSVPGPVSLEYGKVKAVGAAMLVPVGSGGSLQLLVTTAKGDQRPVTVTNGTEGFQKGKRYTITLEFKSTAMTPSAKVTEWTTATTNPSADL